MFISILPELWKFVLQVRTRGFFATRFDMNISPILLLLNFHLFKFSQLYSISSTRFADVIFPFTFPWRFLHCYLVLLLNIMEHFVNDINILMKIKHGVQITMLFVFNLVINSFCMSTFSHICIFKLLSNNFLYAFTSFTNTPCLRVIVLCMYSLVDKKSKWWLHTDVH